MSEKDYGTRGCAHCGTTNVKIVIAPEDSTYRGRRVFQSHHYPTLANTAICAGAGKPVENRVKPDTFSVTYSVKVVGGGPRASRQIPPVLGLEKLENL